MVFTNLYFMAARTCITAARTEQANNNLLNTQRMYQLAFSISKTNRKNCIPTYLKSPEVIGDSEACQCDVIILSYKNKCTDTSFPHVQYLSTLVSLQPGLLEETCFMKQPGKGKTSVHSLHFHGQRCSHWI